MLILALSANLLTAGQVLQDARTYATAPVRWDASDWGLAAAAVGVTAALVPLADRPVRTWMRGHQDPRVSRGADVVRQAGNGWVTVPALGLLWGTGRLLDAPRAQRTAREAAEALAFSTVPAQLLKLATGRRRPFATDDALDWNSARGADGLAFPSGHAQAAWAVLGTVGLEYRDVPGIAPLAFGLATACAASRAYDGKHWGSDVLVGSLLGFGAAWSVVGSNRGDALQVGPQGVTLRF